MSIVYSLLILEPSLRLTRERIKNYLSLFLTQQYRGHPNTECGFQKNKCFRLFLQGNTREVLHKFTVDLPKKHGRGGQSALRFARLRMEKRHNYVRKVAETAVTHFITNDKPNCSGKICPNLEESGFWVHNSDNFCLLNLNYRSRN